MKMKMIIWAQQLDNVSDDLVVEPVIYGTGMNQIADRQERMEAVSMISDSTIKKVVYDKSGVTIHKHKNKLVITVNTLERDSGSRQSPLTCYVEGRMDWQEITAKIHAFATKYGRKTVELPNCPFK